MLSDGSNFAWSPLKICGATIIVSEAYEASLYDSDLLRFYFIRNTIKNPIKKIKKQNPSPAPVYPFVSPWTIILKIVPMIKWK